MTKLNNRIALEPINSALGGFKVIDLYKSQEVGSLWEHGDQVWGFALVDGRNRTGSYGALCGSLKKMFRA